MSVAKNVKVVGKKMIYLGIYELILAASPGAIAFDLVFNAFRLADSVFWSRPIKLDSTFYNLGGDYKRAKDHIDEFDIRKFMNEREALRAAICESGTALYISVFSAYFFGLLHANFLMAFSLVLIALALPTIALGAVIFRAGDLFDKPEKVSPISMFSKSKESNALEVNAQLTAFSPQAS